MAHACRPLTPLALSLSASSAGADRSGRAKRFGLWQPELPNVKLRVRMVPHMNSYDTIALNRVLIVTGSYHMQSDERAALWGRKEFVSRGKRTGFHLSF